MKFKKYVIGPNDKPRYWFATNPEEMRMLQGVVKTALKSFPQTFELSRQRQMLHNIAKGLKEALGPAHQRSEDIDEWMKVKDKLKEE